MRLVFLVALLMLGSSVATRLLSSEELHKLFLRVARNEGTPDDLSNLQDVFRIYRSASNAIRSRNERRESLTCLICRSGLAAFFDMVGDGATEDTIINSAETMCTSMGILRSESCRGILELNVPIFIHILRTTPEATARTFCALVLQKNDDANYCGIHDARFNWTVDLPEPPNIARINAPPSKLTPLTIALITDAHIDPLYEPNGVADCNEPTCCRKGQVSRTQPSNDNSDIEESITEDYAMKKSGEDVLDLDIVQNIKYRKRTAREERDTSPAGFWGDYRNCDTPIWAYNDVIKRVSSAHRKFPNLQGLGVQFRAASGLRSWDPTFHDVPTLCLNVDMVYYMGDSIDHHVWETTYDLINEVNAYVVDTMRRAFGDNVPIIPTVGNHESQPTNQFAPITVTGDKLNTTWLYDSLARKWNFYLTEEAKSSLRKLGAFSMLIRPGLRTISVNTNVAYRFNWWVVYDPLDAKQHLDWLVKELYKAELAGEKVHILAHMPPAVDLTHTWTREYNRIVNRFSATIAGEFNGHTHSDEFKIFYSTGGSPANVAWGAGSATAYTYYNLNYKIATIDPTTFKPLSIANYIYNLTEANLSPRTRPHWFQLYDMKNTFGLTDLSPKSMDELVKGMATDKPLLLEMYAAFFSKLSDTRWPQCDDECKIDTICRTVVTVLWEREKCDELRRLFFS